MELLGIILFIVGIWFNSRMDADVLNIYDKKFEARYLKNKTWINWVMYEWVHGETWENKYDVRNWMIKNLPSFNILNIITSKGIYTVIAKDVIVIFLDLWHFCKACMMCCWAVTLSMFTVEYFNSVLTAVDFPIKNITIVQYSIVLFIIGGSWFNFCYYRTRNKNN